MNMKEEENRYVTSTFSWRIENFSNLHACMHYSDVFFLAGLKWQIIINPEEGFSMFLGVADALKLPPGWTICANFTLTVVNQFDPDKSITMGTYGQVFKENETEWGYQLFMPVSELYDSSAGYLVNDICIIEATVDVPVQIEDQGTDISASNTPHSVVLPTSESPGDPSLVEELSEVHATPTGEVMEFRGLCKLDKAFVPLLEEVCSQHPSLITCVQKRSPKFTECAFTALGQVLHFLKTTKAKDMNEKAYERLQILWEELVTFKFNLAWLEPYVRSALGIKKFVEVTGRVKRLRDDVDDMENDLKKRWSTLIAAEVDLEITRRNLPKTREIDMNSEVGYGKS